MRGIRAAAAAVVVVVVGAAGACATPNPHVTLPRAPAGDAPYDQRAAYYKAYALDSREADHMFLHGGDRVYWPEDLLPAVDDQSPAAMAIRDHVSAREKVEKYQWLGDAGVYTMGAGLVLLPGMLVPLVLPIDESSKSGAVVVVAGASIACLVGGLGLGVIDWAIVGHDADVAGEAADRAARTYQQALSDRLAVGVDANGHIVDDAGHGPSMLSSSPSSSAAAGTGSAAAAGAGAGGKP